MVMPEKPVGKLLFMSQRKPDAGGVCRALRRMAPVRSQTGERGEHARYYPMPRDLRSLRNQSGRPRGAPALGAEYLRRNQQGRNRPRKGDSGRIISRAVMIALVRGLSFYQRQHFLKFDRRVVDSFRRNTEMMRTVIPIGGIGVNMSENISVGHVAAHIERVM